MSQFNDEIGVTVKTGVTITDNMAVVFDSADVVDIAGAGEEANFAGFAVYGGAAGERILIRRSGHVKFIASETIAASNQNAALKLAANGRVALAGAETAYIARVVIGSTWGGQGGTFAAGTSETVTAGNVGVAMIEKGVTPA